MSYQLNRCTIGDRIHFNSVTHPKFKHNRLSVNFVLPLDQNTASDNAAVPLVLRRGCRQLPDFSSLNARLCDLYGAVLDADVTKHGAYQLLEVSIRGLDNRFALESEDITAHCAELLASVALDPKLGQDGLFDPVDVELEKQFVIDSIEAEINEKRVYAISRCVQEMCAGEPLAVRRYGDRETAEKITPASVTSAYRRALKEAPVEIFFTGSGNPESAKQVFTRRFEGLERAAFDYTRVQLNPAPAAVKEKTERMDVSQGKMVLGFRTGALLSPEEAVAMRLFSALYGGTPFSKLFTNVREKLSLCYYCASRFDVATGLLLVDSGVEQDKKQTAQKEILRQLEAVKRGEFSDEELANTKLLVRHSITNVTDSLSAIEGWYTAQVLRMQNATPQEDAAAIDAVTRQQVIDAANKVTLDTVYFLTGLEKEAQ